MCPISIASFESCTETLLESYRRIRSFTEQLCETLSPEDCCLQSMTSASPVRWHLAHTSWFFETFLLKRDTSYRPFDEHYEVLFNSYYNAVGEQFPRAQRGLLSRPSLSEVMDYRRHVDGQLEQWLSAGRLEQEPQLADVLEVGLHHEQQHQELILTDVKHLFSLNPLLPTFRDAESSNGASAAEAQWVGFEEGLYEIGHSGDGFAYDNEQPRHRVFCEAFSLADRLVTNAEYLQFMADGGYEQPHLWLSLGWTFVQEENLRCPLYWLQHDSARQEFTLAGVRALDPTSPVTHINFFEADAFARWAGRRLPTESEWEVAAQSVPTTGNFVDSLLAQEMAIHPQCCGANSTGRPQQMFGDVWEWTSSSYAPYPGFQAPEGALGEYNGKFMCNQYVLRGGSCATVSDHIRATYRNFFPPEARWQFAGVRLAK